MQGLVDLEKMIVSAQCAQLCLAISHPGLNSHVILFRIARPQSSHGCLWAEFYGWLLPQWAILGQVNEDYMPYPVGTVLRHHVLPGMCPFPRIQRWYQSGESLKRQRGLPRSGHRSWSVVCTP